MGLTEQSSHHWRPREGEKGAQSFLKEIMAGNFPSLGRHVNIQVHEANRPPHDFKPKLSSPRHVIIKLSKILSLRAACPRSECPFRSYRIVLFHILELRAAGFVVCISIPWDSICAPGWPLGASRHSLWASRHPDGRALHPHQSVPVRMKLGPEGCEEQLRTQLSIRPRRTQLCKL